MAYENIRFAVEGKIARLALARPPLNVLNLAMMREMTAVLEEVAGRNDLRVLVISGEGKGFSAGVEVGEHIGDTAREMIEVFHGLFRILGRIEIPVVGLVHGMTLGGGCELAALCDLLFASDKLKFGQPEIQVGVFPPVAAAAFPRRVGWAAAADLVLSGRVVGAEEALRLGFVSRVFPADGFAEQSEEAVQAIASLSGAVLRAGKRALIAGAGDPLAALSEIETIYLDELMKTEDADEGLRAFLEKRKPVWKDR
ncbi:MAG: enoyl-CoA hydratase/isomerase family protein [Planctomycetota bacterium]